MKVPRARLIVLENGEIASVRYAEQYRIKALADALAESKGVRYVVDQDGDYVFDMDQGELFPLKSGVASVEEAEAAPEAAPQRKKR